MNSVLETISCFRHYSCCISYVQHINIKSNNIINIFKNCKLLNKSLIKKKKEKNLSYIHAYNIQLYTLHDVLTNILLLLVDYLLFTRCTISSIKRKNVYYF